MADLGANLRAARKAAGISLAAIATRTHYSKALLGHLETGRRAVKPEHVLAGDLERRVIELRHLDDVIGGVDLFPVVSKEVVEAERVERNESICPASRSPAGCDGTDDGRGREDAVPAVRHH